MNLRLNLLILTSVFFQPIVAMGLGDTALKVGFDAPTQEFLRNVANNPPKIGLDLSGLGRDGAAAAGQIGEGFGKGLGGGIRGEFKQLLGQIGTDVPKASDEVMSGVAQAFNKAFREGSREFTGELNGQVAPEFDKFAGSMSGTARQSIETVLAGVNKGIGDIERTAVHNAIKATAGVLGIAAIIYVGKLVAAKYVERYMFEPNLIEKRSSRSIFNIFRSRSDVNIRKHMVIDSNLARDLDYIMNMTKNIQRNGGQYENVLLYGAPGTGKTLFAELLAEHCGMDYAIVPAARISQFLKKGTVVQELDNLFEWAARSKRGTIIFLDEAEIFLADRSTLSGMAYNALNFFLTKTGTPSDKIMVICTTNRRAVIDQAVLDRLGLQVEFTLPSLQARQQILQMHIQTIFAKQKGKVVNYKFLQNDDNILKIAQQLDGCSGRVIQKFVNRLRQYALGENQLFVDEQTVHTVTKQIKKAWF